MFDSKSEENFLSQLSPELSRVISTLSKQEPWNQVSTSEDVVSLLDSIGNELQSHVKIEKLSTLPASELTTLFVGLTIGRYLASMSKLATYDRYFLILQKAHNHIADAGNETLNNQVALHSRLRTLVKFDVISRIFSSERLRLIYGLIEGKSA